MYPIAILIGGPTAAKKTQLAFDIQSRIPSIIINSDSMQVYSDLKTLTNIPAKIDLEKHSCNLFEFINYPQKCNVGFWLKKVKEVLLDKKDKIPIFVGGTGLYLESLEKTISPIPKVSKKIDRKIKVLHQKYGNAFFFKKLKKFDPLYSQKISENDTQRLLRAVSVKVSTGKNFTFWHGVNAKKIFKKIVYISLVVERDKLYESINKRCLEILKSNVIDEVYEFQKKKKHIDHPLHKSIGFKVIEDYIDNKYSFDESLEMFQIETRRYAKRQMTWFRNRSKESLKMKFEDARDYLLKNF